MTQPERVVKRKHTATVTAMRDPVSSLVLSGVGGGLELGRVGRAGVGLILIPVASVEGNGGSRLSCIDLVPSTEVRLGWEVVGNDRLDSINNTLVTVFEDEIAAVATTAVANSSSDEVTCGVLTSMLSSEELRAEETIGVAMGTIVLVASMEFPA